MIKELADQINISFHETSAKANIGIKDTFEDIMESSYKSKFINKEAGDPKENPRR